MSQCTAKCSRPTKKNDEYVEEIVCESDEIKENEMKTFKLDGGEVLLVKQRGIISALGTKCPHYGAPLVNAALGDGRIRCQWHGACFNITTGDIEEFPGLDSLPCYKVTVENNNVKVRAKRSLLVDNIRVKPMVKRTENERQSFVVIGGGPAGATCVESLRQEGFQGKITLVSKENCLPYDRVKVSKSMDFDIEQAQFRTEDFYKQHDIDILKGVAATSVCTKTQVVTLDNNQQLKYDKLLVATGARPKKLDIPGADLKNVVVLRDYEHSRYTNSQLSPEKEVVILGSSFVGMEAANFCLDKVKKVTVIAKDTVPFEPLLGERIGSAFLNLFTENGLCFIPNSGVTRVNDDGSGAVSSVELVDGTVLQADIFIMGVGCDFNTELLRDSEVEVLPNGSVEANEYLETNVPNVFVAGDLAYAPVWSHHNEKSVIGHYALAHYHGKIAALNMVDKKTPLKTVPFFWTKFLGICVRYAGHGKYTDIFYVGDVEERTFVAFYLDQDEIVAVSSCNMDPIVSQFAELLAQGKKLIDEDLLHDPLAWRTKILL